MSLEEGREAKREGQSKAAGADSEWLAEAKQVILQMVEEGKEVTAEMVTDVVGMPESRGAVGTAFSHLARAKQIEWTGKMTQCTRTQAHASDLRVWKVYSGKAERDRRLLETAYEYLIKPEGMTRTLAERSPNLFARKMREAMEGDQ